MGVCVKQVGGRIPAAEVVLARALVSVVLSWLLVRRAGLSPWGQRRGLLIGRGAIGSVALLCVYIALAELPLASATVLQYLYPTFTALLAWLMLGERIGRRVLLAVLVGWTGVLLVARPAQLLGASGSLAGPAVLIAVAASPNADGVLAAGEKYVALALEAKTTPTSAVACWMWFDGLDGFGTFVS
jgi:drug/metabolite transporter (DMT)-like permease